MFTERAADGKAGNLELAGLAEIGTQLEGMFRWLLGVARDGTAQHEVEEQLFKQVMALGRSLMGKFLTMVGPGDLGLEVSLQDGRKVKRWPQPMSRRLVTVFGEFSLERWVYGTRPDQKIELVPTDQRLELPEGEMSYLLQQWSQLLGIQNAFGTAQQTLRAILGFKQPVDTLERGNRQMATAAAGFRQTQPMPKPQEEGKIMVVSEDNKGVPMVRSARVTPAGGHRGKGEKANKKQMACVGCVYTIQPHVRTPEELTAALFRDPELPPPQAPPPVAQHKHYWVSLTRENQDGQLVRAEDEVFANLAQEIAGRRQPGQVLVHLTDGQHSLETHRQKVLPADVPQAPVVDILDLMHVLPRLWQAGHLFHREGSPEAARFVRQRLERVLQGQAGRVVGALRQMGTKQRLAGARLKQLKQLCAFLEGNLHRMCYDQYLKAGYPIASGVIEGACRHLVRDRMERAGMRWKVPGAQAMLELRAIHANGDWDQFQIYRIQRESARLYPHRGMNTSPDSEAA